MNFYKDLRHWLIKVFTKLKLYRDVSIFKTNLEKFLFKKFFKSKKFNGRLSIILSPKGLSYNQKHFDVSLDLYLKDQFRMICRYSISFESDGGEDYSDPIGGQMKSWVSNISNYVDKLTVNGNLDIKTSLQKDQADILFTYNPLEGIVKREPVGAGTTNKGNGLLNGIWGNELDNFQS